MSTVVAPSAIDVYSALVSTPDWTSFEEACEHNSDMKSWNKDVKTIAEKALISHEGGEGLSIHSLKPFTEYVLHSNKTVVDGLSTFKERIMKEEGVSKVTKEAHEEMVDSLGDQYIKMSSHMMDFLYEMEKFLTHARDSHEYVARVIQQYFKTETDKRDAKHYRLIVEKLEELKCSDNVFEHSAEGLLEKAEGLKKQHEDMLQKLQDEIKNLELAEQRARDEKASSWTWKHITSMILTGIAIGITIATAVVAVVLAPPVAVAIAAISMPIVAGAGAVAVYLWKAVDTKITENHRLEVDKFRRKETRVVIRELGDIKSSIESVIIALQTLLYKPDSAMDLKHKEDIDFTVKRIDGKLNNFLNKINELDADVETCKKDVRKARQEVYTQP
ncbi:hypothetical protein M0R45_008063 [Rubus argutus]|uniref:Uncharacterized protein n=1 Tax=Rubus argutus TaxID=59490 RepID=A0AAW1Y0K7_RUBAR